MTALPERLMEAAARAYREAVDSLNGATDQQIAEAVIRRALAVAEAEGAGVFVVPEERRFLSGEGEHVDFANAGAAGHNTCRAAILAGRVTL
jgi:hypothetical protein